MRTMIRSVAVAVTALAAVLSAGPARAMPAAEVTWQSPTTFKVPHGGVIYPMLKVLVESDFGNHGVPDEFFGTIDIESDETGDNLLHVKVKGGNTNRAWSFRSAPISAPDDYTVRIRGEIRDDGAQRKIGAANATFKLKVRWR